MNSSDEATTPLLLSHLGDFASSIAYELLPENVARQGALTLLDTLGCMLAGSGEEDSKRLRRAELISHGLPEATIIGTAERVPAEVACRINAYQGDIFELNDLTGGHAGIAAAPVALALGQARCLSGQEVIAGIVASVEVTSRIYAAYYPAIKPFTETGMAPPGLPSTFGAAAGAARLMGLDAAATGSAIAIAGALASWCPAEVIFGEGGSIKPMLFGSMPGNIGIMAARYAAAGLSGPPGLLESRIGFFATVARDYNPGAITDNTWHIASPRRKLHACCGYIHSALDTIIALRKEGVDFQRAVEVRIGMPEYLLPVISKSNLPRTPNEARFHAEYMLALGALGVDAILPEHSADVETWLARQEIRESIGRMKVTADRELTHYHQSSVEVVNPAGTSLVRQNFAPLGTPSNPMDDDAVRAKFLRLAAPVIGDRRAEALRHAVENLADAPDLREIVGLLEES